MDRDDFYKLVGVPADSQSELAGLLGFGVVATHFGRHLRATLLRPVEGSIDETCDSLRRWLMNYVNGDPEHSLLEYRILQPLRWCEVEMDRSGGESHPMLVASLMPTYRLSDLDTTLVFTAQMPVESVAAPSADSDDPSAAVDVDPNVSLTPENASCWIYFGAFAERACMFARLMIGLMRDRVGGFVGREEADGILGYWLANQTLLDDDAPLSRRVERPFVNTQLTLEEIPGRPGEWHAAATLYSHRGLPEFDVRVTIGAELAHGPFRY